MGHPPGCNSQAQCKKQQHQIVITTVSTFKLILSTILKKIRSDSAIGTSLEAKGIERLIT